MIKLVDGIKKYKGSTYEVAALDHVTLEIASGEFVAIMGKSGSGKSTLLNVLGCMDVPDAGQLFIDDIEVGKLNKREFEKLRKEKVSFIFQKYELMSRYTVYENIELPLNVRRINRSHKKQMIEDIMKNLDIETLKNKFPNQLSGGEQQRVAIARAYVAQSPYILADEPTGALDEKNTAVIMEILQKLHAEGKTVIVVTHDESVAGYADRVINIVDGKIEV